MSDVEGDESALIPGTTFGSRTEFMRAVAGILAVTSRSCYFPDNNKEKITARCKIKECSFFVRGRLDSAGCVCLTSANVVHSCPLHSYPIPHSVITQSIARESLQYTEGTRATDVISRARVDHGVAINYKKAYDSLKHEAKKVTRTSEESYGMIMPWLDTMKALNPDSQVAYQDNEHGRVDRVFLALASWSESSKHCLPVISLDACHLRSATSGTMFLASAWSPNRDIVILAVGIGKIEDGSHWEWFVSNCKTTSPVWEEATTVVMSDREKGLSWALESVAPEVPHSYCSFHIKKNVKTDLGGRIHTMAKCLTEDSYDTLIEECKNTDKAATDYLEGISRDNWTTRFFTRPRYGQVTTNIAESSNSWLMN